MAVQSSTMNRHWFPGCFRVIAFAIVLLLGSIQTRSAVVPGHVEAWGYNNRGQATVPPGLEGVVAVAAGDAHSLALRTNGTVVEWGSYLNGPTNVPSGLSNVVAIAAGGFSAALKSDGTVVVWGSQFADITNVPPTAVDVRWIAVSQSTVFAIRSDGTVVAWGIPSFESQIPAGLSNVVQIAALNGHLVLALTRSGTIVGWGGNTWGESSHPLGLTNVIMVGVGQGVSAALKADGTMFRWGNPSFEPPDPPSGLAGVTEFDVGFGHALALRGDGTVVAWGANYDGEGSVPPLLNGVTAISAGASHNLVITARPVIQSITPPINTTAGANVTLTVSASGEALRYQWQHKGTNLPTGTNALLTIRSIGPSGAGGYAVYVINPHGYNYAATSVSLPPPTITAQPQSKTVYRGEIATFSVTVGGFEPFRFQWAKDGELLPSETNATLMVRTSGRDESASYRVLVTDAAGGTVTSSDAVLSVLDPRPNSLVLRPTLDTSIHSLGVNPRGSATILAGTRHNLVRDRGLLRFDLSSIPTNAIVENAELRLKVVMAPRSPAASTFYLHRLLKPWGVAANWTDATNGVPWATPGGQQGIDYVTNGVGGTFLFGSSDYGFGSTKLFADLDAWIKNPATNHGWILISDGEGTGGSARHFGSSESTTPPELAVVYTFAAEIPTITGTRLESTNFVFEIVGSPGWFYTIEARDLADRGTWFGITNVPAGAGLVPIVISIPATNSQQYFRASRH